MWPNAEAWRIIRWHKRHREPKQQSIHKSHIEKKRNGANRAPSAVNHNVQSAVTYTQSGVQSRLVSSRVLPCEIEILCKCELENGKMSDIVSYCQIQAQVTLFTAVEDGIKCNIHEENLHYFNGRIIHGGKCIKWGWEARIPISRTGTCLCPVVRTDCGFTALHKYSYLKVSCISFQPWLMDTLKTAAAVYDRCLPSLAHIFCSNPRLSATSW